MIFVLALQEIIYLKMVTFVFIIGALRHFAEEARRGHHSFLES